MRKSKYVELAKNGPADKFMEAFNKTSKEGFLGPSLIKREVLVNEAVQSFKEGRAENIQMLLQTPQVIKYEPVGMGHGDFLTAVLAKLTSGNADSKADIIDRALAKATEEDRQTLLNHALGQAIENWYKDEFIRALLRCGANPADDGRMFAHVISHSSPSLVKEMETNGASFDRALSYMQEQGFGKASMEKLEFYRQAVSGEDPAPASAAAPMPADETTIRILETVLAMQAQIDALTEKVETLTEAVGRPQASAEKKQTRPYPKI